MCRSWYVPCSTCQPEGTSTATHGNPDAFMRSTMVSNGARRSPWKLNPKIASTMTSNPAFAMSGTSALRQERFDNRSGRRADPVGPESGNRCTASTVSGGTTRQTRQHVNARRHKRCRSAASADPSGTRRSAPGRTAPGVVRRPGRLRHCLPPTGADVRYRYCTGDEKRMARYFQGRTPRSVAMPPGTRPGRRTRPTAPRAP